MRSFATILATISLPLYALAAHHGNHARDHGGVALRARGDLLPKRNFPNARMTYYDITVGPVACGGATYGANDFVIALNHPQFGNTPGSSPYCGQTVTITYNGNTVSAVVVDECMGCPYGGIDCTEGVFKALAGSLTAGVIYGTWDFGSGSGSGGGGGSPPKEQPTTTSTPVYIPPKTTSTTHYDSPSPIPHTTSTPPPPPPPSSSSFSSSTSTSETSSWASTTSMTTSASQSHSLSESSSLASTSSSVVPYPSGVADPGGAVVNGQTNAIADIYNCIYGLGQIILSS